MALWTEIDPAALTGFAREAILDAVKGNDGQPDPLVNVLPFVEQAGTTFEFMRGANGNAPLASWRAFDAEPAHVSGIDGERVIAPMAALSLQTAISEADQLRLRTAGEEVRQAVAQNAAGNAARGIVARTRMAQGEVLATGKFVARGSDGFKSSVDFGRAANLTATAGNLWSAAEAKPLDDLRAHAELIESEGGLMPSRILLSRKALNLLLNSAQVRAEMGVQRPVQLAELQGQLGALGLPSISVYEGRTREGRVLAEDTVVFAAGDGEAGATVFGQTLASTLPDYGLAAVEQPGVVVAAFVNEGIPPVIHIYGDALVLPVLTQPNATGALKVL